MTPFELYKKKDQVPAASKPVKQDDNAELLALDLIDVIIKRVQNQNHIISEEKVLIGQLGETNTAY